MGANVLLAYLLLKYRGLHFLFSHEHKTLENSKSVGSRWVRSLVGWSVIPYVKLLKSHQGDRERQQKTNRHTGKRMTDRSKDRKTDKLP